jgi:hypothetical protein
LTNVDKTAAASQLFAKFGNVDVAMLVDLRHAQKSTIETSTVVKIKLRVLIYDAARIDCGTKIESARNNA